MKSISKFLKRNIATGLLIIIPIGVTIWVTKLVVEFSIRIIKWTVGLMPPAFQPEALIGREIPGLLYLVVAFVMILLIGLLGRIYFVRFIIRIGEYIIHKIPLIRAVYSALKQLLDTIFVSAEEEARHRKVVLIEYPRKGIYCLAFVTSEAQGIIQEKTSDDVVNVFLPTTPNPTSGFYLMLPKRDVVPLDMSMEDAAKLIMSAGVVAPESKKP